MEDSELVGQDDGSNRHLDITAYDRTKVGTGGGSLIAGGKAGLGAAITYSEVDSITGAYLSKTQISGFDLLQVHSLTASLIGRRCHGWVCQREGIRYLWRCHSH